MKKKDVKVVVLGKPSIKTLSKDQMDILLMKMGVYGVILEIYVGLLI